MSAALAAYADGHGGSAEVLAALAGARLLLPVVAVLDDDGGSPQGVGVDTASRMATVSTTGRDGRRGLLAFTSTATMRQWNRSARPVPVTSRRAAEAALADKADALVIDLAGPVTFAVDAGELRALAAGWRPVGEDHGGTSWAVAVGLAAQQEEPAAERSAPGDDGAPGRHAGSRAVVAVCRLARRVVQLARGRAR